MFAKARGHMRPILPMSDITGMDSGNVEDDVDDDVMLLRMLSMMLREDGSFGGLDGRDVVDEDGSDDVAVMALSCVGATLEMCCLNRKVWMGADEGVVSV